VEAKRDTLGMTNVGVARPLLVVGDVGTSSSSFGTTNGGDFARAASPLAFFGDDRGVGDSSSTWPNGSFSAGSTGSGVGVGMGAGVDHHDVGIRPPSRTCEQATGDEGHTAYGVGL
jgi:hypothetical protein